ncbi:hypothetical protein FRB99_008586 [Tulasnella sp. 403]|nr:hypothetical protein FRB99_008586 [Tulasnella sp. 403]
MPPRKTTAPNPTPTSSSFTVQRERMTVPPAVIPAKSTTHSQTPSRIPTPRLHVDSVHPQPPPEDTPSSPAPIPAAAEWSSTNPAAWGAASTLEETPRPTDADGDAPMGDVPVASLIANALAALNTTTIPAETTLASNPPSRRRSPPSPVFKGSAKRSRTNSRSRKSPPAPPKEMTAYATGVVTSSTADPTRSDVFGTVETPRVMRSNAAPPVASGSKDTATKAVQLPPDTTLITPFVPPEHDPFAFMDDKTPQKKKQKAATPSSIIDIDASDINIAGSDDAKAKADAAIAEAKAILETAHTTLFPSFRKDLRDYGMVCIIRNESFRAHFSAPPAIRLGEAV